MISRLLRFLGGRSTRVRAAVTIAAVAAMGTGTAVADFTASGSGTTSGTAGTLSAPTIVTATAGAGTVALSWSSVTAPSGSGGVTYYVAREGGVGGNCPTSSAPTSVTSCTDSGLTAGTYHYTVTAVWRSWTAKSATVAATLASGALDHFVLNVASSTPVAGTADNLTITAKDAAGNTVTSYAGDQSLTFSGANQAPNGTRPTVSDKNGSAVNFGTAETITFASGVAGPSNVVMKLYKTETANIVVTQGAIGSAGTSVTVSDAGASSFAITPATFSPTAGSSFNVTVTAKDAYLNTATSYSGTEHLDLSGPHTAPDGIHAPTWTGTNVAETFTAGAVTIPTTLYDAETTTLTAKDHTTNSITGTSAGLTVSPGANHQIAASAGSTQTAGTAFNVTLTAQDTYANPTGALTGAKNVSFLGPLSSPSGAAPTYPSTASFSGGTATVSVILVDAQSTTITVNDTSDSLSGTTNSVTVAAAGANSFGVSPANPTPTAGTAFNVTVTAKDLYLNVATSYSGTEHLDLAGPDTAPDGTHTPTWSGSNIAETFTAGAVTIPTTLYDAENTTLTAKDHTTHSITGTSASLTVSPAANHQIAASAGTSQTAGTPFNVTLTAQDSYANPTGSLTGTKSVSFSGPSNSPSNAAPTYPSTASFSGGTATVSVTLVDAQSTTITASDTSDSLSGTASNGIAVAAGTPARYAWTNVVMSAGTLSSPCLFTCTDTALGNSGTLSAAVSVTDSNGNIVTGLGTGHSVTVSATQDQSGGAFTAPSSGSSVTLTIPNSGAATSPTLTWMTANGTTGHTNAWTDILSATTGTGTVYTGATMTMTKK